MYNLFVFLPVVGMSPTLCGNDRSESFSNQISLIEIARIKDTTRRWRNITETGVSTVAERGQSH